MLQACQPMQSKTQDDSTAEIAPLTEVDGVDGTGKGYRRARATQQHEWSRYRTRRAPTSLSGTGLSILSVAGCNGHSPQTCTVSPLSIMQDMVIPELPPATNEDQVLVVGTACQHT